MLAKATLAPRRPRAGYDSNSRYEKLRTDEEKMAPEKKTAAPVASIKTKDVARQRRITGGRDFSVLNALLVSMQKPKPNKKK